MNKLFFLSKYIKRLKLTPLTAVLYSYIISKIIRIVRYIYANSQSLFDEYVDEDIVSKSLRTTFGIIAPDFLRPYFSALTDPFIDIYYNVFGTNKNWTNYLTTSEKIAKLISWFGPFIVVYLLLVKLGSVSFRRKK